MMPQPGDLFLAANSIPLSFTVLIVLAALGEPLLSLASGTWAALGKRVMLRRLAAQLSAMGFWFSAYAALVCVGTLAIFVYRSARDADGAFTLSAAPATTSTLLVLALVSILWALCSGLKWRGWANYSRKKTMAWLGSLATIFSGWVFLHIATNSAISLWIFDASSERTLSDSVGGMLEHAIITTLPGLLPPAVPHLFAALALFIPFALCAAASVALGYLLHRRPVDDFGRDYYRNVVRLLARFGLFSAGPLLLALGGLLWLLGIMLVPEAANAPELLIESPVGVCSILTLAAVATFAIACIFIQRAENPMRLKPAIVLQLLLLWLGAGALCYTGLTYLLLR